MKEGHRMEDLEVDGG